jgi:hypothetical protein
MTKRAGQIAPAPEDQRSNPPGEIEQTRPLKTFDTHMLLLYFSTHLETLTGAVSVSDLETNLYLFRRHTPGDL